MKKILLCLAFCLTALNASANDREFRCEFDNLTGDYVQVEVWRTFNTNPYRRIEVTTSGENSSFNTYQATVRLRQAFYELEYWGTLLRFSLDLFPDRVPQFGRSYQADFSSPDIDYGHTFRNINCQYLGF